MIDNDLPESMDASNLRQMGGGIRTSAILLGFLIVVIIYGVALVHRNMQQPQSGLAPNFTITTIAGDEITLSSLHGRIVILNFWASWCGPCRLEAPTLQLIWERYKEQDVVVLGIIYADTDTGAEAFISEFALTYPNAHDIGTIITELYNVSAVPETFVIDKDGDVVSLLIGPSQVNERYLTNLIEGLLSQR